MLLEIFWEWENSGKNPEIRKRLFEKVIKTNISYLPSQKVRWDK